LKKKFGIYIQRGGAGAISEISLSDRPEVDEKTTAQNLSKQRMGKRERRGKKELSIHHSMERKKGKRGPYEKSADIEKGRNAQMGGPPGIANKNRGR